MTIEKQSRIKVSGKSSGCTITMSAYVYQRMRYLVDNVDAEVAWLGTVEKTGNVFNITEIYVFDQEVTGASVNAESDDIAALADELVEKHGKEEALMNIIPNMRAFCHSHHTMKTFWSATDEDGIDGLGNSQFLVSLVLNRAGSLLGRLDFFKPHRIVMLDVPVTIDYTTEFEDLAADVKNKVSVKLHTVKTTNYKYKTAWSTPTSYDKNKVSIYGLPNLVAKADPELKPAIRAINDLYGKTKPIKDLGYLIFSVSYEYDMFEKRMDDILKLFKELKDLSHTDKISPALKNEIIECIYALSSQKEIDDNDPDKTIKLAPASSVISTLLIKYGINANVEYCAKP